MAAHKENYTIRDIARICKVGVSTVSRAINDDPDISEATRERILKVIDELHYVPNNSARNLKMADSNTVALLVRGIDNYFYQGMYDTIEEQLEAAGFGYMIHAVGQDDDMMEEARALIKEKRLHGLIILGGTIGKSDSRLATLRVPLVLCTVAMKIGVTPPPCTTVSIDDERASYEIVKHLIESGHRYIAILAGLKSDKAVGAARLAGYQQALEDAGIPINDSLIYYMHDDIPEFTAENGYAMCRDLLDSGEEFSAIFAISDLMAIGVYKALQEAGRTIPEDVSVVGFDGINLADFLHPTLTTVVQPREEMARCAVNELIRQMNGDSHVAHNMFETKLLIRNSVTEKGK